MFFILVIKYRQLNRTSGGELTIAAFIETSVHRLCKYISHREVGSLVCSSLLRADAQEYNTFIDFVQLFVDVFPR